MGAQAAAYLLTLVIEAPLSAAFAAHRSIPLRQSILAVLVASTLTHPVAWWASRRLGPDEYAATLWLIEAAVCAAEAGVFRWLLPLNWRDALLLSVGLNAASAVIGGLAWVALR